METVRLTMAQALVRFLNAQYLDVDGDVQPFIKGVFTIFGHGNVLGVGQALEEDAGHLDVYQGRNEQGMAQAAVAFAKQKRRKQIMACTTSVGPGSANLVTAAATATANQIPVLLLPGDVFATRQPDPVLQQIEQTHDLSISTNDALRPVSRYWDRVMRPEQLMSAMLQAMRVLTDTSSTGAVSICLPQDVQTEAWDYPLEFFSKRIHTFKRRAPSAEELQSAVTLIASSERPLIVCGGGVRYSEAGDTLRQFAEALYIPIVETQAGKSAVSSECELNLGGVGVTGNLQANHVARQADLVIGVGTRYTDFTTASKSLFSKDARMLSINPSSFDASKLGAVEVEADAKAALSAMLPLLQDVGYQSSYGDSVGEIKNEWQIERERLSNISFKNERFEPEIKGHLDQELKGYAETLGSTLTQTSVLTYINQAIAPDSIVVGAAGSLPGDMQRLWEARGENTYHMEYGYSCMGYEIAGAFGAKLAEPDKEVYAMTGDGSFLMLHSELVTSLQENQKITILLFDNAGFGCINNLQMGHGMGSYQTEFRNKSTREIMPINYAQVAAGYGAAVYEVRSMEELESALESAKNETRSTLLDIKVLPKTMTDGYGESWWHVGVAEVSSKEEIKEAYQDKENQLQKARRY